MPSDPSIPSPIGVDARQAERLAQLERRLAALEQREGVLVVTVLPAPGREGRLLKVAGGSVYVDQGTSWTAL